MKCGFARLSGQWPRCQCAGAERRGRAAQRQEHGREIPAPPPRVVGRGGVAHDHGASAARRRRAPGIRAALPAQVRRAQPRDARPRGAGALARSGGRPGDAGRVPLTDGIERTHRAARRLDPAPGGSGSAALAGRGTRARPRRREHLTGAACAAALSPITCSTWSGEWRSENVGIDIEITEGRVDRRCELGGFAIARAAPFGSARRHRRFRHRVFLAEPPGGTAGGHAQDRPQLRERS